MEEIRKAIQAHNEERKSNIAKGIYQDNAKNRKDGKVGQKYGGKKEEGGKSDEEKLDEAIEMFTQKIKDQGRVTNARDEEHLERLKEHKKKLSSNKTESKKPEGKKSDAEQLDDAIAEFTEKIKKQGMVTNARDAEHLERLIQHKKDLANKK